MSLNEQVTGMKMGIDNTGFGRKEYDFLLREILFNSVDHIVPVIINMMFPEPGNQVHPVNLKMVLKFPF